MDNEYGIELKLLTTQFKQKLREVVSETKKTAQQISQNATFKTGFDWSAYTNAKDAVNAYNNSVKGSKVVLKQTTDEVKKFNNESSKNQLGVSLEKATKKGRQFLLSLFSIRSAWAFISRASSTYLSENEALNESVKLTASIFGNILGPVIEKVVNVAEYSAIFIARLVQSFTGFNALAKVSTNSLNKMAKAGKSATKSLAGFDTITNLGGDTSGLASGIENIASAYDEFQEKVQKIQDIFDKYEPLIKGATIALGVFAGVSMISKLGNLIGNTSTGLLGVQNALLGIKGLSVITIAVTGTYMIKETIDVLHKKKDALKEGININRKYEKSLSDLVSEYNSLKSEGKDTTEVEKELKDTIKQGTTDLNVRSTAVINNRTLWEKLSGTLSTTSKNAFKSISDEIDLTTEELENLYNQGKLNEDETNDYKNILEKSIDTLRDQNKYLDVNSEQYKINKDRIDEMRTSLEKVGGKEYKAKLDVDAKTDKIKEKLKKIFNSTGYKVIEFLDPTGLLPKSSTITKWINSFDVGTNYVPNDQLAMVHKGEMIVPAKYNPSTSGIGSNEETNYLLNRLISVVESKEFNAYLDSKEIGKSTVNYINTQNRIQGRSVIK